jgi:uncharacterized protein (TIGR02391 family)
MILEVELQEGLWDNIRESYVSKNYSAAILDAIKYMTTILRERAYLDGDGSNLVTQALGGSDPRIRIGDLKTATDQKVQAGYAELLRGIYTGIRNPRAHELIQDSEETANAIICFIDFLIGIIGVSSPYFSIDRFLSRVSDRDFVPERMYADLLTAEVPAKERLEALAQVFRNREHIDEENVVLMIQALFAAQSERGTNEFMTIVSREYEVVDLSLESVSFLFKIIPPEHWERMGAAARLRIENRIVRDLEQGEYHPDTLAFASGAFALPARDYFRYFERKARRRIWQHLYSSLRGDDPAARAYTVAFYLDTLVEMAIHENLRRAVIRAISDAVLEKNDEYIKKTIADYIWPEQWRIELKESLSELAKIDPDYYNFLWIGQEDIPF